MTNEQCAIIVKAIDGIRISLMGLGFTLVIIMVELAAMLGFYIGSHGGL